MKLQLTACKEVIRNKFNVDDKYNNSRSRLDKHMLILSDALLDIWEKDAKENDYLQQFENWYFSLIHSAKKLKRVKIPEDWSLIQEPEQYIVVKTAAQSKDKMVVGHVENTIKKQYKNVYFIEENIFNKPKSHTITVKDIEDVWDKDALEHIFDIYETPIRINVEMGDNAKVLGEYLSLFYRDSKNITIKDTYIDKHQNEKNLNTYVLKYLHPNHVRIAFRAYWNEKIKDELIHKFTNYNGYKSKVFIETKKQSHQSYIQSDKYIIDLGYRLRVFGDKDDGKTEAEIITITKK